MPKTNLEGFLRKEMTRKEFLAFSAFAVASVFGVVGLIKTLLSHAATPTADLEPESGTRSDNASIVSDSGASGGAAVKFSSTSTGGNIPGGAVTHGQQLTLDHVGPWTLQGVAQGSETLSTLTSTQLQERLSTWPSDGRPSWIPGTNYAYNNNPTNYGGVVPAGGMVIDGYNVPAGTWVVQFRNFSGGVIISGDNSGTSPAFPGVFFRGCRMRGGWGAPGWFNQNGQSPGGIIWIAYSDAGGKTLATTDYCESIFESKGMSSRDTLYLIRNYLSNATTLAFLRNSGDAAIENFCAAVSDYGDHTKHLNGIANSGNQTSTLWLRNNMVMSQQAGSTNLTDVIQMAADDGAYPGTGTNLDGSQGYAITDNYLGGAQFTLQLGYDKNNTISQVRNVKVTGNKFSTSLYASVGSFGLAYKTPDFSNYGNTWANNTYADGPNAGQLVSAPAAGN